MANTTSTQIILDGARNAVVKLTGALDTSNLAYTVPIQVASFHPTPTQFRIDHIDYSIADGIEAQLFWDATSPVVILPVSGRGRMSYWNFGGLQNDAGAGKTGGIGISVTQLPGYTYTTGEPFVYIIILELVKQGVLYG